MDLFVYAVYAVALLLVVSVALFVKVAIFDKRPQKIGLIFALLAVPLFMIYYADRWPWGDLPMRKAIDWLNNFQGADINFESDYSPAFIMAGLLLIHMMVIQRVAVRRRLEKLQDPIATFFASALFATLAGGIVVSTFHWGWVGSVIVGVVYTLVYLGVLALLAAIVEIVVELAKLIGVWLRRRAFALATMVTRVASWVSSLSGRLGLTTLAERIRAEKGSQEMIFRDEQDEQDKELFEAFLRDRARQRRMSGRTDQEVEDEIAELSTPSPSKPGKQASSPVTDEVSDIATAPMATETP